jgi:hypothetical protein
MRAQNHIRTIVIYHPEGKRPTIPRDGVLTEADTALSSDQQSHISRSLHIDLRTS